MIATLRSIIDDDQRWFSLIHDFYQHFKYRNIQTDDVMSWWNDQTAPWLKMDLTPLFNQYLRHTAIPAPELNFDEASHVVLYKWQADEPGFAMPVRVGVAGSDESKWDTIHPTLAWQAFQTPLSRDELSAATDLFYINVSRS